MFDVCVCVCVRYAWVCLCLVCVCDRNHKRDADITDKENVLKEGSVLVNDALNTFIFTVI